MGKFELAGWMKGGIIGIVSWLVLWIFDGFYNFAQTRPWMDIQPIGPLLVVGIVGVIVGCILERFD